jgi:parallel beta-helix repeat protein
VNLRGDARLTPARRLLGLALAAVLILPLAACAQPSPSRDVVHVPQDAATIGEAVELVAENGLVLVSPGTYHETVIVDTPGVTIRGMDRNEVVIDGEGLRANGIEVIAAGVRVQNLTVVNHTFNGVLVTGMHDENGPLARNLDGYEPLDPAKFPPLERFEVSNVTASNNGLYGIYAFNSHDGVIRDNYASGSADAGFYVGQCEQCDILVQSNVAENNAIGYENANASDSVVVVGNRFTGNRVGLTLLSWYQEAFLPQRSVTVVGNLIADNDSSESPAHVNGAFGIGVGLSGANTNLLERNLIAGNPSTGVQLVNTEDLGSTGNRLTDNQFENNGVDVADVSSDRAPSGDTCVTGSAGVTLLPLELEAACGAPTSPAAAPGSVPAPAAPPGVSFLQIPFGPDQPGMSGDLEAIPDALPGSVAMPDLDAVPLPDRSLLQDRARS